LSKVAANSRFSGHRQPLGIPYVMNKFSTGVGSEVQRRLATVIVFGIATDTVLTMLVLPVMYLLFGKGAGADLKGSLRRACQVEVR